MARVLAAPQIWTCECGADFTLSERNSRLHRTRGTRPRCYDCRHPASAPSAAERLQYRNWWLERFSREQLEEIAFAVWPEYLLPKVPQEEVIDSAPTEGEAGTEPILGEPQAAARTRARSNLSKARQTAGV